MTHRTRDVPVGEWDWHIGDRTLGLLVVSVVRVGGEIVQIGVRGEIADDGYAWHGQIDPLTERLKPEGKRFYVGEPTR